ncbi:hypothetical protein AMTRI_Chr09g35310 [Amborella trichopoda]|uniref:B box-type domain-containing protein n=1 Tax=Amborella trichopoda TaxID=13333 RepID=W1NLH9_AMBTC|nr:B-box zinc finger protein 20 [Amborella trichopoda]ERM96346.1 hypothetical protein AMTR_s00001p00215760 [Amborella trichopoda]|eukprot:XP_006828930.1 B-box zinc finger protein 20 [Amborella trichopoda]
MKIQCDVCNKAEASVFCCADEAALCSACDQRVHHANKLAGKHRRFSLHHPCSDQGPRCDVCQERRAFLFCQEDRAILCRECDIAIHTANDLTYRHNRFLLTGVKLQSIAADTLENKKAKMPATSSTPQQNSPAPLSSTSSSISEYLTHTIPGWRVDDFLTGAGSLSPPHNNDGLLETDELLKLVESDFNGDCFFPSDDFILQIPKQGKGWGAERFMSSINGGEHHGFTVPQISPPTKRQRLVWQM